MCCKTIALFFPPNFLNFSFCRAYIAYAEIPGMPNTAVRFMFHYNNQDDHRDETEGLKREGLLARDWKGRV